MNQWLKNSASVFGLGVLGFVEAAGQVRAGTGPVVEIYRQHCAVCHGRALDGGLGGSLLLRELQYGDDDAALLRAIRDGFPDAGMQGFADVLSAAEQRALVVYLQEMRERAASADAPRPEIGGVVRGQRHTFRIETLANLRGEIWALEFLPSGELMFTTKEGQLQIRDAQGGLRTVSGTPEVWLHGQGGLLDVELDPDYGENGWIYIAYAERSAGSNARGMTVIARGKVEADRWVEHAVLWRSPEKEHSSSKVHFGTRLVRQGDYLYFAIGDRGRQDSAQQLSTAQGAVHRIHPDGRVPQDNPFVGQPGAVASIWSYGHRNPQGMALHPSTGELWATEHGPRGGDELNRIQPALNYGWPEVTHGLNYNGTPITEFTSKPGMQSPVLHWTPSIATCGIDFVTGAAFPQWRGDLLVTGLVTGQLQRLRIADGAVIEQEVLLRDFERLRDVKVDPQGVVYLAVNLTGTRSGQSRIVRLVAQ